MIKAPCYHADHIQHDDIKHAALDQTFEVRYFSISQKHEERPDEGDSYQDMEQEDVGVESGTDYHGHVVLVGTEE